MSSIPADNYYNVLGLPVDASLEEIKEAYKILSLKYHPDKQRRKKQQEEQTDKKKGRASLLPLQQHHPSLPGLNDSDMYQLITQAYEVLSDNVNRAIYDLNIGVIEDTIEERARIQRLKRKDAEKAIALMEETVSQLRAEESEKNGLLIVDARYGVLSPSTPTSSIPSSLLFLDVTVPLQCMVSDSSLVVQEGVSKCWLEGFYDPQLANTKKIENEEDIQENQLYIRYKFLGHLHEVILSDLDPICIPMQEHLIPEGANSNDNQDGSASLLLNNHSHTANNSHSLFSPEKLRPSSRLLAQQKKRRRFILYSSLFVLSFSAYSAYNVIKTYRNQHPTDTQKTAWSILQESSSQWIKEKIDQVSKLFAHNKKTQTSSTTATTTASSSTSATTATTSLLTAPNSSTTQ